MVAQAVNIQALEWLDEIIDKIARKHHVTPQEVRDVFNGGPSSRWVEKGHRSGEDVYVAGGRTAAGRPLVVLFVYKKSGSALILTARDMTRAERRLYAKR